MVLPIKVQPFDNELFDKPYLELQSLEAYSI